MLKRVTITGADDSISPEELVSLQKQFPFSEWGILVSRKNFGTSRFPSKGWINELEKLKASHPILKLSCHLCGSFVREFYTGDGTFIKHDLRQIWHIFDRVQLNTHGQPHPWNNSALNIIESDPTKEFIFQFDNVNNGLLNAAELSGLRNISVLFDLSHGTGIVPEKWPIPFAEIRCGYAGGISPANIEDQIQKIEHVADPLPIWIDMETHVRSNYDELFDIKKVRQCLDLAAPYVNKLRFDHSSSGH